MKVAYLIDRESVGGGCEYIRRSGAADVARGDVWKLFCAARGECRPQVVDAWGADRVVVNHIRALVQLMSNPFRRPKGRVAFVVHGVHLRKYDWRIRESGGFVEVAVLRMMRMLRRMLEASLYRRCDSLVALTSSDREDILRLYGRDLNVVIEPNTLQGWVPALAERLPPDIAGSFRYVCIGRFDYPKGQDRWIRRMGGRRTGCAEGDRTLFIGDGPTLDSCKAFARKLGVDGRCVFAGTIPEADRYLKCAEIVVSPSRWEGMPYLMMKARALGCRILATDCAGNRDVLAGYERWEKLEL